MVAGHAIDRHFTVGIIRTEYFIGSTVIQVRTTHACVIFIFSRSVTARPIHSTVKKLDAVLGIGMCTVYHIRTLFT